MSILQVEGIYGRRKQRAKKEKGMGRISKRSAGKLHFRACPIIILELDHKNYPLILRQFGAEGAKAQAISMCIAQGRPITKENLEGLLTNLEEGLEEMFEGGVDDPQ